jgi:hypothetical protein
MRYPFNINNDMRGKQTMAKMEGGCLCGQIRYKSDVEPLMVALCHCKNCQRQSGSAYSTNIIIPKGEFTIEGELTLYVDTGDSGHAVHRYFCQNCGSAIVSESDVLDTVSILKVGTLDDTSWVTPTMEIYCDSAQEWTKIKTQLESHPKMLPS